MPVNARGIKHCVDLALLCTRLTRQNFRGQHAAYAKNSHKKPAFAVEYFTKMRLEVAGYQLPERHRCHSMRYPLAGWAAWVGSSAPHRPAPALTWSAEGD
jgi:hypothetical protein